MRKLIILTILLLLSCARESPVGPEIEQPVDEPQTYTAPEAVVPAEVRGNTVEVIIDSVIIEKLDTIVLRDRDTIFIEQLIERIDTLYVEKKSVQSFGIEKAAEGLDSLERYIDELERALYEKGATENTEQLCTDDLDNDADELVDCDDPDCTDLVICNL
jgi:hypothetical protein